MFDYDTLITDRTAQDVSSGAAKGRYDYTDLNRVTAALEDLHSRLLEAGYTSSYLPVVVDHLDGTADTQWREDDEDIRADNLEAYRANVAAIRADLAVFASTPAAPDDLENFRWTEANAIEQILADLNTLLNNMAAAWFYSGDLYAGEV